MGSSCSADALKTCGSDKSTIPANAPVVCTALPSLIHQSDASSTGFGGTWMQSMSSAFSLTGSEKKLWASQSQSTRSVGLGKHTKAYSGPIDEEERAQHRKAQDLLYQAARGGDFRKLTEAVTLGADVDNPNNRGCTPLMMAAASRGRGGLDCIMFLVEALADIDAKDNSGWTPLFHACRNSQATIAEWLVERQASLRSRAADGRTCLMLAVLDGADALVHQLLNFRASLEDKDDKGWTVLFHAIAEGRGELVKTLLKRAADVRKRAHNGDTVLTMAGKHGDESISKALTRHCSRKGS